MKFSSFLTNFRLSGLGAWSVYRKKNWFSQLLLQARHKELRACLQFNVFLYKLVTYKLVTYSTLVARLLKTSPSDRQTLSDSVMAPRTILVRLPSSKESFAMH